jgi:hypothetical protein
LGVLQNSALVSYLFGFKINMQALGGVELKMDLHTHVAFGVAVGLVFFGQPESALLVGLGAMLPDLDREYWFIPLQAYRREQYHRAALHNVFIMILVYLVSPFLSLGVFLHVLQDSFTTCKDRGCEWFYPFSRLVKLGLYDENGHPQPLDPKEKIYFYQEDPHGLVEHAELDLRGEGPSPWRRVYGPAQNSHLLDRGFLYCSIAIIVLWIFLPDGSNLDLLLSYPLTSYLICVFGFVSVAILFLAGELDRIDKPLRVPKFNFIKKPIFVLGIILFVVWLVLYRVEILANLENIFSNLIPILLGALIIFLVSLAVIRWQTRTGKTPALV